MFSTPSLEKLLAGHEHVTCPGSWGQSRELVIPDCKEVNPVCTSWGPDPLSILLQSSFSPSFLLTSLSHWSLNPCAQQVVYCLSKHLLLLSNIPFQPSLKVRLLLPFLSINQPRTELHCSPFSLTSAYFSPVGLPQSTVFQNNLVAPIFCSSNKHESPTELCWETSEFTTGLKITPFQKHQLLHNWKLKLWTSCGLFYLQSEIDCFCRLLSAHSSARIEKKKRLYNATSLKYVEKGKITNLKHLQVKAYHAIQIPLEFTKQKVVKCQSKFLLTFHVFHPHLQTSPKFPVHMAAGWGVPMSTVSMNPPPAEPAPSQSWPKGRITASDYSWVPST